MRHGIAYKGALPLARTCRMPRSSCSSSASGLLKGCVTSDRAQSRCVVSSSSHSRSLGCGGVFRLCLRHAAALPLPLRGGAAAAAVVDPERCRVVAASVFCVVDAAAADLREGGLQQSSVACAR